MSMLASNTFAAGSPSGSGSGNDLPNQQRKGQQGKRKACVGQSGSTLRPAGVSLSHAGMARADCPSPTRWVAAGVDILSEGEDVPAYVLLLQGWAAPYKCLCEGRRQFFDILIGRDGIRGLRSSRDAKATLSMVALTDCNVWQGNGDELRVLNGTRDGPNFDEAQTYFIEQHLRMLNLMTFLGHTRAPERVAYCLLELWKRQLGDAAIAGARCPLPIKQGDIGDATGLTGVHVCRTLATFKKLGIVRIADGQLTVMRPLDLADIAGTLPFEGND